MEKGGSTGRKIVSDILKGLEDRAPSQCAETWDNVGLLVGDSKQRVKSAVVSIDLTAQAITAAKKAGNSVIVTHHPCIFPKSRGLSHFTAGGLPYEAARAGISVIACHTNFDQCALEVPEAVSKGLGFRALGRLHEAGEDSLRKLVVYVPVSHVEQVLSALTNAGAGQIGNYDSCSFKTEGEGRFRGREGTNPFHGKPGVLETVSETRVETILPKGLQDRVLRALFQTHPYEEVAYDIYELKQAPTSRGLASGLGYGVWGEFDKPKSFSDVTKSVMKLFQLKGYWVTDPVPSQMKKIAFVAGKGSAFLSAARAAGCDLFITGEAGYHDALKGSRSGMAVMELGHRESEKFFLSTMKGWLKNLGLKVVVLEKPTQKIFTGDR